MIEKLGIASEIKAKSKFPPPAGFVGTLLTIRRGGVSRSRPNRS